jgi:cytochrome P450
MIPGGFLLGSLREWKRDPLAVLRRACAAGEVASFRLGPRRAFLVSGPEGIERVLVENHRNYSKRTPGQERLRVFLGYGLLTSEGSFWLRQRRMTQPAFHRQKIAGFAAAMSRAAVERVESWGPKMKSGEPFDLTVETTRLALRVVCDTLLGIALDGAQADAVGRALSVLLGEFRRRLTNPLLELFAFAPTARNLAFKRAIRDLDRVVMDVIAEKRRRGGAEDLLSMLMEARDEDSGEAMDDRQLRDEVMTLFLAGFETTANALNWTFVLLSRHPEVDARLRRETRAALAGRPPALEDLPRLPYALAVLKESMRLFPPAWIIVRRAESDDVVCGVSVPKGALMMMSPYATHREARVWKDPERFDPERFLDGRADALHRYAYFPFGGGPRQCIGNAFALMEAHLVIAAVSQSCRLELVEPGEPAPEPTVTLRPRRALMVRATNPA